ncbi:MAG: transmembrane sensor [Crocinitomix sp.]|jgi:transmembrane sensor
MDENEKIEISDGLLMGHINDELDADANKIVSNWIESSESNQERYNSLLKAWDAAGTVEPKPVMVNTDSAWKNVVGQINEETEKVIPINRIFKRRMYLSIAASVVVLFGVLAWMKFGGDGELEYITMVAEESGFIDELPDGSSVTFNKNTSLIYPSRFAENERRVKLNGEAFFDIERNEEKPFIIDLPQESYVKVLGTSFNIKAADGDSLTEVFVSTGKVEFGNGTDTLILTAGQKGIYNHNTGKFHRDESTTVGLKDMFWKNEKIRFDDVPLNEAIGIVNSIVGDSLILDCPSYEREEIFTSYNKGQTLENFLISLMESHPVRYSKTPSGKYRIECDDY